MPLTTETKVNLDTLPDKPARERVLVCLSSSHFSAQLLRVASQLAATWQAEWLAVHIETPRRILARETDREQLKHNLRLAEELGAETLVLTGQDVAEELLNIAQTRRVTQIIIGKTKHSGLWQLFFDSIVDRLIRCSRGINIHVIPGNQPLENASLSVTFFKYLSRIIPYVTVLLMVTLITILAKPLESFFGLVNIAMIYLLPVLYAAMVWGVRSSIIAAVLAFVFFEQFFVPSAYFKIIDLHYFASFTIFLLVALLVGRTSTRLRQQINQAQQREAQMTALYGLSREIAATTELKKVLEEVARKVAESIEGQVVVLLPNPEGKLILKSSAGFEARDFMPEKEQTIAAWVFERGEAVGPGTNILGETEGIYLPLITQGSINGVLGVRPKNSGQRLTQEQRQLLDAFASFTAVAINRIQLVEEARESLLLAESERLRTALLNSISHDLRTPLTSIMGAVTGLLEEDELYSKQARGDLLQTIKQGALRMERVVNNLLDMARLESGVTKLNLEWCDVQDIMGVAISRCELLRDRPVQTYIESGLPLIQVDFVLIEQVLVNLLDNALKYSDGKSPIYLSAQHREKELTIAVSDRGPRIPEEDLERVFEKFYRLKTIAKDSGIGLGLTICKAIIEAHGGRIWAANNPDRGVTITLALPLGDVSPGKIPAVNAGEVNENEGNANFSG